MKFILSHFFKIQIMNDKNPFEFLIIFTLGRIINKNGVVDYKNPKDDVWICLHPLE